MPSLLRWRHGLELGRGVEVRGMPLIEVAAGARIALGAGVVLNSLNDGYHVNMFAPVKLLADKAGARIEIGEGTRVHGSCIHAWSSVVIGKRCLIAANSQLFDSNAHEASFPEVEQRILTQDEGRPIRVEDCVWIGTSVLVLPGVTIGRGSVVAAGSVVSRDVPPFVVVAGNPAKVVKDHRHLLDEWRTRQEGAAASP